MGEKYGAASFIQVTAPELEDRMLAELMNADNGILISLHIRSIDQDKAIKTVKRKITDLDSMKIDAQKRAVREGFDMEIIPTDIATYAGEAKNILHNLQSRNERMFLVTFLIINLADTQQKLKADLLQTASVVQRFNCQLTRLDFQQEQGLVSALPLGVNQIKINRGLTTSSLAVFVPFTTQELFQEGSALYYGINAISGNMVMADRKTLRTPNGLILGTPGSGKSFSAKREITNVFLITQDDVIICDPEAEYFPLVHKLGGQVIKISASSKQYVNPMDINLNYSEDDNPLALKSDFILSFCELAAGGKNGLAPIEKTLIDRAVRTVYRPYLAAPQPENVPILGDLYDEIKRQPEPEAQRIASALELYVHGSLNVFNHRTNVDISNRLVCFDIKELGKQLKNLGMLVIQDQVWNRVTVNRSEGKATWYYVDEFHLLLKGEVGAWSVEIWKRFRKWGGIPTGITQNIKDLLRSDEIENIFENSDFIYLLNQGPGDRKILCERLGISSKQESHIHNAGPGTGLIVFGNVILPFEDHFPQDNELYSIMTTKPSDMITGGTKNEP
jgi:type IV secretory pathway VirB4 component